MANNESSAPQMPDPIQGDATMKVTRQKGPDLQRAALADDPMTNMPVIQGTTEMLVTRQTGIIEGAPDAPGVMRADRPLPQGGGLLASDRPVGPDAKGNFPDLGMPDHPGVVPGNPQHPYGRRASDKPVQGSPEKVDRIGSKKEQEAAAEGGIMLADRPLPAAHKTGVVMGNPDAVVMSKEQIEAAKKTQHADRPSTLPDPRLAVHDPMEYQRQMAEASTASHPLNKRKAAGRKKAGGRTKTKGAKRQAGKRGGRAKANPIGPVANPNPAAERIAEGDRSTATEPAPNPVVDLDDEKRQAEQQGS